MSRPYPCCCRNACVHCPDYSGQEWIFRFCGLAIGTDTLVSSTTGNPLHFDLMAQGDIIWVPTLVAGPTPRTFNTPTAVIIAGLASNTYEYSSGFIYSGPFAVTTITGFDDCGKRRLTSVILRCTRSGSPNTIIWRVALSGPPVLVPNCGEELTANTTVVGFDTRVFNPSVGLFKTKINTGVPLACP